MVRTGYMVREELQREMLRERAGIRAWGFEERLERGEGSRIARLCWEEIKSRALERGGMSKWEKERADCYKRWKPEMKEIERKREKGEWGGADN